MNALLLLVLGAQSPRGRPVLPAQTWRVGLTPNEHPLSNPISQSAPNTPAPLCPKVSHLLHSGHQQNPSQVSLLPAPWCILPSSCCSFTVRAPWGWGGLCFVPPGMLLAHHVHTVYRGEGSSAFTLLCQAKMLLLQGILVS